MAMGCTYDLAMTHVALFHHAQGLTDGVVAFADRLRGQGHVVTTPDLYDGTTLADMGDGLAHAETIGFENILARGDAEADRLSEDTVYAGFSLGALVAHRLAQTRPGALGALLYHHGDVPMATFAEVWPSAVDVQIHVSEDDEYLEREVVEDFVEQAGRQAVAELFLYPGSSHLFTDSSLAGYQSGSTELVLERTLQFLARRG